MSGTDIELQDYTQSKELQIQDQTFSWQQNEYFLSDSQSISKEQKYNVFWSWGQYFEFLIYHIAYYLMIGPFINLFFMAMQWKYLGSNLGFFKLDSQLFDFILYQTMFYMCIMNDSNITFQIYLLYAISAIVLRSTAIANKYATLSSSEIHKYRMNFMTDNQIQQLLVVFWQLQTYIQNIFKELINSQLRNNIDIQIYKFSYFFPLSEQKQIQLKIQKQIIIEALNNIDNDFGYQNLINEQIQSYESECTKFFNGDQIIFDLGQIFIKSKSFNKYIIVAMFISTSRIFLPLILTFVLGKFPEINVISIIISICFIIIVIHLTLQNIILILLGGVDLERIVFQLVQLTYMISIQRSQNSFSESYDKEFPTIDILCPLNLQAWAIARRKVMDYGIGYTMRYQNNIAMNIILFIIELITLLLSALKIIELDNLLMFINIYDIFLCLASVRFILTKVALINDHFKLHIKILESNRFQFMTLQINQQFYFENNNTQFNPVLQEILQRIYCNNQNQEQINFKLTQIISSYDQMIDSLKFEEKNRPYLLFGIQIDSALLNSLNLALAGLIPTAIYSIVKPYLKI